MDNGSVCTYGGQQMILNNCFEIASCIFLLILVGDFLYRRQFPRDTTRIFLPFLLVSAIGSISGILFGILLNSGAAYPSAFRYLICTFHFASQGAAYLLFFMYISTVSGPVYRHRPEEPILLWIPAGIYILLALSTPWTEIFFRITPQGQYRYGYAEEITFLLLAYFFVIHTYHLLRYGNKQNQHARFMILLTCMSVLLFSALQIAMTHILLMGLARAFAATVIYLTLMNPGELLDSNTGLFNKNALYMRIREKENGTPYSVIYLNIDKYRFINQTFGYGQSSSLLTQIARELRKICITCDIYRMDRDDFVLLATGHEELNFISAIKERFNKPWLFFNTAVMLQCRMVILRSPEHFTTSTELIPMLNYMDQQAKKLGSGSLYVADQKSVDAFRRHIYIEDAIKKALNNHTLCAFYQPIHSAADHTMVSAEVLSRIPDEKFGFIPTQELIGIAENNGFIVDLGYRVFEEACIFLHKMDLNGDASCVPILEVNISTIQCMQPNLAEQLIAIAEKYHIKPSGINFEITESAALQSEALLHRHMDKLKSYGFTFSIDDYGTGFSNCSYLIEFPFDQVKFDRGMILSYFEDSNARLILDNEFATIHKLGKAIVCEGVEFPDQIEVLTARGVDYFQGHYFSEPLNEKDFVKYIASR